MDLIKFIISVSLVTSSSIGAGLILPSIGAAVWGESMSRNSSISGAMIGIMKLMFTPWFGRWSDTVPRKRAWLLAGILCWAPSLGLLIFGGGSRGLYAFLVIGVLLAPFMQIEAMVFIYLQDLTTPENREVVFGVVCTCYLTSRFLLTVVAGSVDTMSTWPLAPCIVDLALLVLFVPITLSIRNVGDPKTRTSLDRKTSIISLSEDQNTYDRQVHRASTWPLSIHSDEGLQLPERHSVSLDFEEPLAHRQSKNFESTPSLHTSSGTMMTIHFLCSTATLRNLSMIFFMVGLAQTMDGDITSQFGFGAMGLLTENHTESIEKQRRTMTAISHYTSHFSAIFLFTFTGIIGGFFGSLVLIRWLIPVTALAQLMPLLLLVLPNLWIIALMGILSPLGGVIQLPLNTLASLCAPPDRVGEAIAALTVIKEIAPLIGNFSVPPLIAFFGSGALWVFFVMACGMVFLALPFACDLQMLTHDSDISEVDDCDVDGNASSEDSSE